MSEDNRVYDAKAREQRIYDERMRMTTFKPKAIEYLVRAEGAADSSMGNYFASIAQVYATLELARVNASNASRNSK